MTSPAWTWLTQHLIPKDLSSAVVYRATRSRRAWLKRPLGTAIELLAVPFILLARKERAKSDRIGEEKGSSTAEAPTS